MVLIVFDAGSDYEQALSHSTVVIFEIYIKAFKIICSFDMILFTMLHILTLYILTLYRVLRQLYKRYPSVK